MSRFFGFRLKKWPPLHGLFTTLGRIFSRTRPAGSPQIAELIGVARRIAITHDYSIRTIKHGDDEAGLLFDAFNQMLTEIQRHDGDLRGANATLEQRVSDSIQTLIQENAVRKRAETELANSLSVLNAALESTGEGILVVDENAKPSTFNRKFAEMWGIPADVLASRNQNEMTRAMAAQLKDAEGAVGKIRELLAQPDVEGFDVLDFKDGRIIEWYSEAQRIGGLTVGRVWCFRDITLRKNSEHALSAERTLLRTLFDVLPDYIYVKNLETRFVTCNDRCARIMGAANPQSVIGKTDEDFFPAEIAAAFKADDLAVAQGAALIDKEESFIRPDGIRQFTMTTKLPLKDSFGNIIGIVGHGRDITERKQLEEQFRQSQKMDAIGQLSGGIAHDFNNLLTVIMGNLGLMRTAGPIAPEMAESMTEISRAADRAANLTRQLLAFSRQQVMQLQSLDLNEVVANISVMLRRILGETIEIRLIQSPQKLYINADPGMLEQVILNLCINARDAMPRGGRLRIETASVELNEEAVRHKLQVPNGSYAKLSVTDTGVGIQPQHLARVFEPFFTTKAVGKGTGLGLASVYGIVRQHRGSVDVQSEVGQGASFRVYLPLTESPQAMKSRLGEIAAIPRGSETILLVEDDLAVQAVAATALERLGYRVIQASTGHEAMQIWEMRKAEIQIVLSDMVMPEGLTGGDIAERIKRDAPNMKIILMSGYSADIAGINFPHSHECSFLGKPFEIHVLATAVRRCLDSGHAQT